MNKLFKLLSRETTSNVGSDIFMALSMLGGAALLLIEKNKIEKLAKENTELKQEIAARDCARVILEAFIDKQMETKTEPENK